MTDQQAIEPIAFDVPADCPNPAKFSRIVDRAVEQYFGTQDMAAQCRKAWQDSRIVPEPFASNLTAAGYYQSAMLALDARAQQWLAFEEAVNRAFGSYEDDGDRRKPAIRGWTPFGWITFR